MGTARNDVLSRQHTNNIITPANTQSVQHVIHATRAGLMETQRHPRRTTPRRSTLRAQEEEVA